MATVAVRTAAGTTMSVSAAAPALFDSTSYAALTWTAVGGVDQIGDIGPTHAVINFSDLASGGQVKQRGSEDPGEPELSIADIPSDAGQVIMKTAHDAAKGTSAELVSIKVEDEAGNITYAQASMGAWARSWPGNDEIIRRMVKLLIVQGTIVEVAV